MPRLRPLAALLALSRLKARMQGHWKRPLQACRPHSFTLQRLAVRHPPSPRPLRSWHTTRLAAGSVGGAALTQKALWPLRGPGEAALAALAALVVAVAWALMTACYPWL